MDALVVTGEQKKGQIQKNDRQAYGCKNLHVGRGVAERPDDELVDGHPGKEHQGNANH